MANTKNTITLFFICALFFVAKCSKVSSTRTLASTPTPTSGPTSDEEASSSGEEASSPKEASSPEEEASSSGEEASSPKEASSPEEEASSSEEEDEDSEEEAPSLEQEASSPVEEEASSPTEDASSSEEDTLTTTDDVSSSDEETPSSQDDVPPPTSEPSADSPMSLRELFEISLPDIGLKKAQVELNPEGAKVTIKQLEGIGHRINEFKAIITKRQSNPKASDWAKKCLAQCQDNYEDAIDGVKTSIESVNNQDLEKANVDISSISTDIETCNDCFIELEGEDKEINAFSDWVKGVTKECLSNIKKA